MFKIEFFVEDKHLAEALRAVTGRARNLSVVPVLNAVAKPNGAIEAEAVDHTLGSFLAELKKLGDITPATAQEAALKIGSAKTSYGYLLKKAVGARVIKKRGKGQSTTYAWV